LLHKTKTKNSILRLKLAGEPSQRASQQPLFLIGGVYLKKSEPILLTGSAGGIPPPNPPSARLAKKRKRKDKLPKNRKNVGSNFILARSGLFIIFLA
jgi:hypothetical protein